MSLSASLRIRTSRRTWAAAAALCALAAPALAAAQPAPYTQPPYAGPQAQPPAPPPRNGEPPQQPSPYDPYQGQPGPQDWAVPPDPPEPTIKGVYPILRASPGVGIYFPQKGPALPSFDLDITGGVGLNFRHRYDIQSDLVFEASYSYSSEPTFGGHFFAVGATPILQFAEFMGIGLAPKFVVGRTWQGTAVGARAMLVVPFLFDIGQGEVGYQWLRVDGKDQHEMRFVLGVDVLRPLIVIGEAMKGLGHI